MVARNLLERLRSPAEVRITVPAAPAAVFAVLADRASYPQGPGGEVLASEPPTRLVREVKAGILKGEASFELERTARGTLVTVREHVTGALAPAMPLLRGPIFLRNRSSLDKLKQQFEPLVVRL